MFTISVDNIQDWLVKVSNCLDNYLQYYDNLQTTRSVPHLINKIFLWHQFT